MIRISQQAARKLALRSQYLSQTAPPEEKEGIQQVIEHLGYVQIDTISVIRRAHHHVLWSRVNNYRPELLKILEEQDRAVFEYWGHAASYLPMKDYRFSLARKEEFLEGDAYWFKKDEKTAAYILDRIRREGPLMSRDFKNTKKRKSTGTGMDWTRNPLNLALRQLFMEGRIMVSGRRGFQKVYDLPERIIPDGTDTRTPQRAEYIHYLIDRDLRAHGLVRAREIGYLLKGTGPEIETALQEMLEEGSVVKIKVEGIESGAYFARPKLLENLAPTEREDHLHFLSPFDNLIIQRQRLEELFGFSYTLECYTPKAKRKFGYFGLPLLLNAVFAGQIDLKADRKQKVLLIRNLEISDAADKDLLLHLLANRLKGFARFNDCEAYKGEAMVRMKWGKVLKGG